MKYLTAILMLALSGCATTANFTKKMDTLKDQPVSALVQRYGAPDKTLQMKDSVAYSYHMDGGATLKQNVFTDQYVVANHFCDVTFMVQNDVVKTWSARGDACRSK